MPMLEILYRIYKTPNEQEMQEQKNNIENNGYSAFALSQSAQYSILIAEDCLLCDDREQFKESIKSLYGDNIKFAYSKKYPQDTLYCIIVGEHCYNAEKRFTRVVYECDFCHKQVITFLGFVERLQSYDYWGLPNNKEYYKGKVFCCSNCKNNWVIEEKERLKNNNDYIDAWVSRDDFIQKGISGYIYKITKKSTGQFYIGQTKYLPVFRWAQHLKTKRFDLHDILDYSFETIEIVNSSDDILEREKYWIQKYYRDAPSLSLNIIQTAGLEQTSADELFDLRGE